MARYVLDTHALLWFLTFNPRLGAEAKTAMLDAESELILPAIALAESLWIVEKLKSEITPKDVLSAIDADTRIIVSPLTRDVVERATPLLESPKCTTARSLQPRSY